MIFTVELSVEIEAANAEDAAALAVLTARDASEVLTLDVYSDTAVAASGDPAEDARHWRRVSVDVRTLEAV